VDFPVNFIKQFVSFSFGVSTKFYYGNSYRTLPIAKNIAYHIPALLIFYADKLMVMGNSKNLHVFDFAILFKSRKFDARKIYMFYSMLYPKYIDL